MRCPNIFPLLVMLLLAIAGPASAQLPLTGPEEETAEPADAFQRETPRSTVTALVRALAEQDYTRAGQYFAIEGDDPAQGARLARALQASLDAGGELIPFAELSNEPAGAVDDGLPPRLERVGTLSGDEQSPILLARAPPDMEASGETVEEPDPAAEPAAIWRISKATIADLQEAAERLGPLAPADGAFIIAGAPAADWAFLLGVLVASFVVLRVLAALVLKALCKSMAGAEENDVYRFLDAALPPFSLLLAVIAFRIWADDAPVAIVARQVVLRYIGIIAWIALAWFAVRLVDAVASKLTSTLDASEQRQAVSAITLARRAAKLVLIAVAAVAILDTFGIDITTGLAALGIGGLALALGAQKTVENLVGSVTVVADRPIQVGDFCRVGDVLGTVEDIGIRSTRIRTLERTVVTIPNGDFSSRQIENYARRDRFLFKQVIGLEYDSSAAQLRHAVSIIENALIEHPLVAEDSRRARLINLGASSIDIEVFTYIEVPDYDQSLDVRQELLLTIFDRLEKAGLAIAFPTQTIYLRREGGSAEHGQPDREARA